MENDLLVNVDSSVEPDFFFFGNLDLFLINSNAIRSLRQILITILRVVPIPVVHGLASAINAEHSSTSAHSASDTEPAWSRHASWINHAGVRGFSKNGTSTESVASTQVPR